MKGPNHRSLTSLFLVAILLAQTSLSYSIETNFWKDRRRSEQYAALPLSSSPKFVIGDPVSLTTLDSRLKHSGMTYRHLSSPLKSIAEAISLSNGTVQDVFDGSVETSPVILLQDIHMNTEAQSNLAEILQSLINQNQISSVGVEGAFGQFDFSEFREFQNKESINRVAQTFLKNNWISAPSFVGVTSPVAPPKMIGVDDPQHYAANVKAYWDSENLKEPLKKKIQKQQAELNQAKSKIFSKELKSLDDLQTAHHNGSLSFTAYVEALSQRSNNLDFSVQQFLEASRMERALDFARVDVERRQVVEKLAERLSSDETANLVSMTLAYRSGRMGFGDYYQALKKLCANHDVSLRNTPAFDNYIRYVLLADGIKPEILFSAVDKLEQEVIAKLARTEEEKELMKQSEHLALMGKLVEFSLTPGEWKKYQAVIPAKAGIQAANILLKPFEDFYREADTRSKKMVENLDPAFAGVTIKCAAATQGCLSPVASTPPTSRSSSETKRFPIWWSHRKSAKSKINQVPPIYRSSLRKNLRWNQFLPDKNYF